MKQMEEEYVGRSTKGQKVRAFTFFQHVKVDKYRPPLTFVLLFCGDDSTSELRAPLFFTRNTPIYHSFQQSEGALLKVWKFQLTEKGWWAVSTNMIAEFIIDGFMSDQDIFWDI